MSYLTISKVQAIGLILISILFIACGGDDDRSCDLVLNLPDPTGSQIFNDDIETIENYIAENNLSAEVTSSGLHYIIDTPGDSLHPTLCDEVNVSYKGYYPNGVVFDENDEISFPLTRVITGWGEGIPLFGRGGSGTILLPSYLGYGNNPPDGIPANAVLIFDVELHSF